MPQPGKLPPYQFISLDYLAHLMGVLKRQTRSQRDARQFAVDLIAAGLARWADNASAWELEILNGAAPRTASELAELIAALESTQRLSADPNALPLATGDALDRIAQTMGILRHSASRLLRPETDEELRARIKAMSSP